MHPLAEKSLLASRPSPVGAFLVISAVGHVVLIAVAMILSWVLGPSLIDLDPKPITASLVRLGKPRDEKLLPRKEEEAPPPPQEVKAPPKPPDPVEAPPVPSPLPAPKAAPQPGAAKSNEKKSLKDMFGKAGKAAKPDELEGEADGDPDGDSAKAEGERYYALLKNAVRRFYDVSNTIPESERITLKANVNFKLATNGEVLDVDIVKSSGNALFDAAVLGAVKKAAPFSPPPDHLRDVLKRTGVTMVFTPGS